MTRLISIVFAMSFVICSPTAQAQRESEVKTAVRVAWDTYIEAFSKADTNTVANDIYAAPSFQLENTGANVRATVADIKTAFDATHARLASERYGHSETDQAEIRVLNKGTALLTAYFTRYRTDGTILSNGASAYLFARFAEG